LALPPMNVTEEVFVREVEEELQRDQMLSLWDRYGKPAVAFVAVVLLGWAAYIYWGHRVDAAAGLEGEKLTEVVDSLSASGGPDADKKLTDIMKSDAKGLHGPAGLIAASIKLQTSDLQKAADAFGAVAKDENSAQAWRDLALIRQTAATFDTMKPEQIVAQLKPLSVSGRPWFGSAGEMTAIAYLRMNKPDLAGKMFADLAKDEAVPETIRNRSSEMANALGMDSIRPAPKGAPQ
jgi:hypothetical protein